MTPLGMILLAVGNLAQRLVGMFVLGGRLRGDGRMVRLAGLLPVAVISAVVAQQSFATGRTLTIDARVVGLIAGALATMVNWRSGRAALATTGADAAAATPAQSGRTRRLPLAAVIVIAAGSTALVRALGWAS